MKKNNFNYRLGIRCDISPAFSPEQILLQGGCAQGGYPPGNAEQHTAVNCQAGKRYAG